MNGNEEMVDEMRIVINNKINRRILSSLISKVVNDKFQIDLSLDIDSIIIDTLPNGSLDFKLATKGTVNKDKIFSLIGKTGGMS